MSALHISHIGLNQFELEAAEYHAKGEVEFCPGEVDAEARAGAAAEGDHEALKREAVRGC